MDDNLEQKLYDAFPNLYADRNKSLQESLMGFGIMCSGGWFTLLWELSEKLERCIVKWKEENPGRDDFPRAFEIKEKLGGLRVYSTWETDEMSKYINEAAEIADRTCEDCGKPGELMTTGHWYRTVCPECALEKGYRKFKEKENK